MSAPYKAYKKQMLSVIDLNTCIQFPTSDSKGISCYKELSFTVYTSLGKHIASDCAAVNGLKLCWFLMVHQTVVSELPG